MNFTLKSSMLAPDKQKPTNTKFIDSISRFCSRMHSAGFSIEIFRLHYCNSFKMWYDLRRLTIRFVCWWSALSLNCMDLAINQRDKVNCNNKIHVENKSKAPKRKNGIAVNRELFKAKTPIRLPKRMSFNQVVKCSVPHLNVLSV